MIREAAKAAGLWDTGTLLEEVTPEQMKKFRETVRWLLFYINFVH